MKTLFILLSFCSISINLISIGCAFQTSFFAEINKDFIGKNLIVSPLSIYQVLGLTSNGAQGLTQEEMVQTLQNKNITELNQINYDILDIIKGFSTVEMANAVMSKFTPVSSFIEISEKYQAPIETLKNVEQVNEWCNQKTHGKITKILKDLDPNTKMLLLNALYFKGEWVSKFMKENTRKEIFYNFNDEKNENKVDTMSQTEYFNYYEDSEIQAVELNYRKDQMSALIILPNKDIDINEYISSINKNDKLKKILNGQETNKVHLKLPVFTATFEGSLKEVLQKMGIKVAFTDKADFYSLRKGDIPLFIGDVIHKTFLNVTEEGTEAAAVTAVEMVDGALPWVEEKIYEMKVNRPFLFFLRNKKLPKGYEFMFMSKIEEIN